MKALIKIQLIVMVCLGTLTCLTNRKVHADEGLRVDVFLQRENSRIAVKSGSLIYAATPVTFAVNDAGHSVYYSVAEDDYTDFCDYIEMPEKSITLFPELEDAGKTYRIKFMEKSSGADGEDEYELYSQIYNVRFDFDYPEMTVQNVEVLNGWINHEDVLKIDISDNTGYLGRVIVSCEDEILYESHYGYDEKINSQRLEIPLVKRATEISGKEIVLEAIDLAGNSSISTYRYYLDDVKPSVVVEGVGDNDVIESGMPVEIKTTDILLENAVTIYTLTRRTVDKNVTDEVCVNAADSCGIIAIDTSEDGRYELNVYARDAAGNTSGEIRRTFFVDNNSPEIEIVGASEGVDIKEAAHIGVNITDANLEGGVGEISVVRKRPGNVELLNETSFDAGSSVEYRSMDLCNDGDYEVIVKATDEAGNNSEKSLRFRIDANSPMLRIRGAKEGEIIGKKPVIKIDTMECFFDATVISTTLSRKNDVGQYEIIADSKYVMKDAEDTHDIQLEEEGEYVLNCTATDRTGNMTSKELEFGVDYTPPVIAKIEDLDHRFISKFKLPANLKKYITDRNDFTYETYVDDRKVYSDDVITQDGKYELWINAVDAALNNSSKEMTFIIDSTAPQLVVGGIKPDSSVKRGDTIELSLSDAEDTFEKVICNGRKVDTADGGKRAFIHADTPGITEVEVFATDRAGNVLNKSFRFNCDDVIFVNKNIIYGEKSSVNLVKNDENENIFTSVIIGLFTVLSATYTLVFRALCPD